MRYVRDTSHAHKDHRKKSEEKAGRAHSCKAERREGGVVKVLYKDTQTEATAGTKREGGEGTHGGNEVKARKSTSVKVNH